MNTSSIDFRSARLNATLNAVGHENKYITTMKIENKNIIANNNNVFIRVPSLRHATVTFQLLQVQRIATLRCCVVRVDRPQLATAIAIHLELKNSATVITYNDDS